LKILLTGADGYIGAVMASYLADHGYHVTGLDTGFYRAGWLYNDLQERPRTITKDIRLVDADDLRGYDAVVHLAELSNDPLGNYTRKNTFEINHMGSVNLAHAAKRAGVRRFVYASSCSVYGAGSDDIKTEESTPNPQTAYAECKLLCEQELVGLTDERFAGTMLRNATAFGASPRMRFDIVLNNLAGLAWTAGEISMTSDGTPWRPLVHILDICRAFELTLKAPTTVIEGQILNVGADDQNYRIRDIANIIADVFPDCRTSFGSPSTDNRSYRVSFAKIRRLLPDYSCAFSADRGARQLRGLFERISMTPNIFRASPFTRLSELRHLVETKQIDARFFWTPMVNYLESAT
jgi:nucleoside-diphosphate-sugar epimerase